MLSIVLVWVMLNYEAHAQVKDYVVDADRFEVLMKDQNSQLVDVRTPAEFKKSHITNALNIDYNGKQFEQHVLTLDKNRPVLIYCLSGGRSAKAASLLREKGFSVYELQGGMTHWSARKKPVEVTSVTPGMTSIQFQKNLETNKIVLVDFFGKWCAPCKKMEPILHELGSTYSKSVVILRIDADQNSHLIDSLKIDALPTLFIYKNGSKKWTSTGFTGKSILEKELKGQL
jgi:thioredoxin